MNASLRTPVLEDYQVIASWITDQYSCTQWAGPCIKFPFSTEALPQLLEVANSESYCLKNESPVPLGFGQLWFGDPGSVHLMRIIVSPVVRGQGLGRELCRLLIDRALEVGNTLYPTLRVYRDNTAALALYNSLGFLPVDSRSSKEALFMSMSPDNQQLVA